MIRAAFRFAGLPARREIAAIDSSRTRRIAAARTSESNEPCLRGVASMARMGVVATVGRAKRSGRPGVASSGRTASRVTCRALGGRGNAPRTRAGGGVALRGVCCLAVGRATSRGGPGWAGFAWVARGAACARTIGRPRGAGPPSCGGGGATAGGAGSPLGAGSGGGGCAGTPPGSGGGAGGGSGGRGGMKESGST
jgi:hypothetical protein